MPSKYLQNLIDQKLIFCFEVSTNKRAIRYIFKNEIAPYLSGRLVYNQSVIPTFKSTAESLLSGFKNDLTQKEYDLLKLFLEDFGSNAAKTNFNKKYNISIKNMRDACVPIISKLRYDHEKLESIANISPIDRDTLINEIYQLEIKSEILFNSVLKLKGDKNKNETIEELKLLSTPIEKLNLPSAIISTIRRNAYTPMIQCLKEYKLYEILSPGHRIGKRKMELVKQELAKYNIKLSENSF